jgi:acetyl-CoA synthetase
MPALYETVLGTLEAGAVYCPLFSAFGPEPVKSRLVLGSVRLLVTTDLLYRRKVAPVRAELPDLRHVLVVRTPGAGDLPADTLDFDLLTSESPADFATVRTRPDDYALLHFTSGTTGQPKGVLHAHAAVAAHVATARWVLDLKQGDVYWCTADPGWVTGISYGVIAPLACGVGMVVDREEFDAPRWYEILDSERISVWYTAPTAIRMLMKAGVELARARRYPALRHLASVGEPLNPEAVVWGNEAFDMPFHDTWWQTETGAIMITPLPGITSTKPGSAARPFPGIKAEIKREDGTSIEGAGGGLLALTRPWPSMLRGIYGDPERYVRQYWSRWTPDIYFTGDGAKRDADEFYWLLGRVDDVLNVAGHRIGTMEVESALVDHSSVAEAAVVGRPHELKGQAVAAFVTLKEGQKGSEALVAELKAHVVQKIGAIARPDDIIFSADLPKTRSGKIMRRLLRDIAEGKALGDTTTLADPTVVARLKEQYQDEH